MSLLDRTLSVVTWYQRTKGHDRCTVYMSTMRHNLGKGRGKPPGERSAPRVLRKERKREGTALRWAYIPPGDDTVDGSRRNRRRVAYWMLTPSELKEEARRAKAARRRAREARSREERARAREVARERHRQERLAREQERLAREPSQPSTMGGVLGELVGNVMGANLNRPRLVVDNTTPRPFAPKPSPTNVRHLPGPAGGERPATRQEIADAMKKLRKQQGWDDAEHPNEGDE